MNSKVSATACVLLILAAVGDAKKPVSIIFGDSLSDTGLLFSLTNGTVPPPSLYWEGRFTGPPGNWVDDITAAGVPTYSFATAGSSACKYSGSFLPTALEQYQLYRLKRATDPAFDALLKDSGYRITSWVGHNDLIGLAEAKSFADALSTLNSIINCLNNVTRQMLNDGERHVVVGTLAGLDLTPFATDLGAGPAITQALNIVNSALKVNMRSVSAAAAAKNQTFLLWDVGATSVGVLKSWQALGFSSNSSCIRYRVREGILARSTPVFVCPDPFNHTFLFHDNVHPSSRVQQLVAQDWTHFMISNGLLPNTISDVPPPSNNGGGDTGGTRYPVIPVVRKRPPPSPRSTRRRPPPKPINRKPAPAHANTQVETHVSKLRMM